MRESLLFAKRCSRLAPVEMTFVGRTQRRRYDKRQSRVRLAPGGRDGWNATRFWWTREAVAESVA
jgi:hypothetical protein